jgi:hypothetical protein
MKVDTVLLDYLLHFLCKQILRTRVYMCIQASSNALCDIESSMVNTIVALTLIFRARISCLQALNTVMIVSFINTEFAKVLKFLEWNIHSQYRRLCQCCLFATFKRVQGVHRYISVTYATMAYTYQPLMFLPTIAFILHHYFTLFIEIIAWGIHDQRRRETTNSINANRTSRQSYWQRTYPQALPLYWFTFRPLNKIPHCCRDFSCRIFTISISD